MSRDQDVCLNVARCKWQQGGDDSMTDDALRHMSHVTRYQVNNSEQTSLDIAIIG